MSLDTVRLSQTARDQLVRLKRTTGIKHWNVLCRWALVVSLRDSSTPLVKEITTDSNVEMDWRTFAGTHAHIYLALLKQRCAADRLPLDDKSLSHTLTVHLHRGIGYLAGNNDVRTIRELVATAVE